jgi:hypothetical protein
MNREGVTRQQSRGVPNGSELPSEQAGLVTAPRQLISTGMVDADSQRRESGPAVFLADVGPKLRGHPMSREAMSALRRAGVDEVTGVGALGRPAA